ncbi:transglutaminase domain-containing protein [Flavobacterium sp.]|uniref:transglutaminase domain-containing protein n=1 Tax=Flavobacterium sp. TaxID=239 RepID=UPI002608586E|nr:transglutaminase domain-containing protein [Flavobacterium sp.]
MKAILLKIKILLLFACYTATAQDYTKVDNLVKSYPNTYKTPAQLAERIAADFQREDERARALFTWIAYNISFDESPAALGRKPVRYSYTTEAERLAKVAEIENDLAKETLRQRKGVCHGYSMVYALTARKLGLECEVVRGNAKSIPSDIGKPASPSNHAWNAVKINGEWKLLDVTWGAGGFTGRSKKFGFRFDDKYFFTEPELFFINHFPEDKKWLLTTKNERDYAVQPLYYDLGYHIVQPNEGVLKAKNEGVLTFKIKGLKATDEVAYQFSSAPFSKKAEPKIFADTGEFDVLFDRTTRGILTIFVNKQSVVAYSVK